MKIIGVLVCVVLCSTSTEEELLLESNGILDIVAFSGAIGDGVADDTDNVQKALTECSDKGLTCVVPVNKSLLITKEVYLWGGINLVGIDSSSIILIKAGNKPYIINVGISGPQQLKPVWTGVISKVTFKGIDSGIGRIIFLWRTDGAKIIKNTFLIGRSRYGPISSGNNNNIVINGDINCIRKNIIIAENIVIAESIDQIGNEGIGLNLWDGAEITNNTVSGVADDMIGIHFSKNINIRNNDLSSADGRLFVSNSSNVLVVSNRVSRISAKTGVWFAGIALIYIGHESDVSNNYTAPTDITVRGNTLTYNKGAIDQGAAIYVYSPRNVIIDSNTVVNNSITVTATGIHVLPFVYMSGIWEDPAMLDTDNVSRVYRISVLNNNLSAGVFSLALVETGQACAYYIGPVTINDNVAGRYSFICNPVVNNNTIK